MKWVMCCLDIRAFISSYNGSFFCFEAQRHFFIRAIIHLIGTAKLSRINADSAFLGSTLNISFVLLEMLSHYLATVIIRASCQNRYSDHASDQPLIMIQWLFVTKHSFKICFFFLSYNKEEDMSYECTFG